MVSRYRKSKKCKNAILDSFVILLVLVVMAIGSIFAYSIFDELNTDIQADADMDAEAKEISNSLHSKYVPLIDSLVLFAFVLLVLFVLISVFVIDTHPIFFVVSLVLLIGVFVVGALLGNAYDDVMTDAEISPYANQFSFIGFIMGHILELMIAVGFLVSIGLFAKFKVL